MSRPRSARASTPAPARGAGAAGRGVYVPSARNDIYTALLGVALAAMVIGCLLLVLVLARYEFKTKVSSTTSAPAARLVASEFSDNPYTVHL